MTFPEYCHQVFQLNIFCELVDKPIKIIQRDLQGNILSAKDLAHVGSAVAGQILFQDIVGNF
ncbi:hypothetical protein PSSHI_32270 [Photobacterium sp. R1]